MFKFFNQYVFWWLKMMKCNKFGIIIEAWTYKECMIPWHFQYDCFIFWLSFSLIKNIKSCLSFECFMSPIFPSKNSKSSIKLIPSFFLPLFYCSNSKILVPFPWNMVYKTKKLCCHMYHILFYLCLNYETIWTIKFLFIFWE
jgi:hypothetical protein